MRTAKQVRRHLLDELGAATRRPSMYGDESYFRGRVHDLAFIDEQEDRLSAHFEELRRCGMFTSIGVRGWLLRRLPSVSDTCDEIASIYARIAALFGWLRPQSVLTPVDHARAKRLAAVLARRGCTSGAVFSELGPPGVISGDVHAYVSGEPTAGWIYFDYSFVPPQPGHYARDGAPPTSWVLRNVRLPVSTWYSDRLRFTPFGRRIARGQ